MFTINANGLKVLKRGYLLPKGDREKLETPPKLFKRVANTVAKY